MIHEKHTAIVTGRVRSIQRFEFLNLFKDWNPVFYSLDYTGALSRQDAKFKHLLFSERSGMQGYMEGLEFSLKNATAIICYETSQLSTYQAVREAKKRGISSIVMVDDSQVHRFAMYKNISGIQESVYQSADYFWAHNSQAYLALLSKGIDDKRIIHTPSRTYFEATPSSELLRKKFRRHCRIEDHELLLSYIAPSGESGGAAKKWLEGAMQALQSVHHVPIRFVVSGQSDFLNDFIYTVRDRGLHEYFRFLNQDISPFLKDLIAASDGFFWHEQSYQQDLLSNCDDVLRILSAGKPLYLVETPQLARAMEGMCYIPMEAGCPLSVELQITDFVLRKDRLGSLFAEQALAWSEHECWKVYKDQVESLVTMHLYSPEGEDRSVAATDDPEAPTNHAYLNGLTKGVKPNQSEIAAAIEHFNRMLDSDSNSVAALKGMALASMHMESFNEARRFLKKAIQVLPNDRDLYMRMGICTLRSNDPREAIQWFKKGWMVSDKPGFDMAMLIQSCIESPHSQEAMECLSFMRDFAEDPAAIDWALCRLAQNSF